VLSELEGAILLEIDLRGRSTAFQVRKAFQMSPTQNWSGSAGAIYPAIKRLVEKGYISKVAQDDARGTQHLRVTPDGQAALKDWATDRELATAINADPFRTRIDYLMTMSETDRTHALSAIHDTLIEQQALIKRLTESEPETKREANQLVSLLLTSRLNWVKHILNRPT